MVVDDGGRARLRRDGERGGLRRHRRRLLLLLLLVVVMVLLLLKIMVLLLPLLLSLSSCRRRRLRRGCVRDRREKEGHRGHGQRRGQDRAARHVPQREARLPEPATRPAEDLRPGERPPASAVLVAVAVGEPQQRVFLDGVKKNKVEKKCNEDDTKLCFRLPPPLLPCQK